MRYGLRTLLLLLTVMCVALGIAVERAQRQRIAVEALLFVHAEIQYDCDTGPRQTSRERHKSLSVNCLHSVAWLVLDSPAVTNDTLEHLESLPQLKVLMITEGSAVSGSGLVHLQSVPELKQLVLASGTIDDRSLEYVANLANLEELDIQFQPHISDAGIQQLAALKQLRRLTLHETAVTQEGAARLQRLLPMCQIEL